jgi:peroxiredoxin (alkyl hydroperoxide reductase subunit C)
LRHLSFNDAPVGRNVDETFRLVQAFQFVEKNGEVCPSNWHPGSDSIIPNPQDKLKYFAQKK